MQQPPYLQPGATIGITCPSGFVSKERIAYAVMVLERWGFKVKTGQTVGTEYHYFSGDDAARLNDLQNMLDDPAIDAILMGRGGYGMSRIIDQIDFTAFRQKPKWICGFSDITVLHNHIQAKFGIPTLHSPMCGAFKEETEHTEYIQSLHKILSGIPLHHEIPASQYNRIGKAEGVLTGGNVAILAHLSGSVSEVNTKGKILFIEDVGEYLYNLDRMLLNLKRAGKFDHLKALVVGSFTDMQDTERPFGQTVAEIIWDKVKEYNYPVLFNFPAGHQEVNFPLALGMKYTLEVTENGGKLQQTQIA